MRLINRQRSLESFVNINCLFSYFYVIVYFSLFFILFRCLICSLIFLIFCLGDAAC